MYSSITRTKKASWPTCCVESELVNAYFVSIMSIWSMTFTLERKAPMWFNRNESPRKVEDTKDTASSFKQIQVSGPKIITFQSIEQITAVVPPSQSKS